MPKRKMLMSPAVFGWPIYVASHITGIDKK